MRAYNKSLIAVHISNSRAIIKARARFAAASVVLAAMCTSAQAQENVSAWRLKKGQILMRDHNYEEAKKAIDRARCLNSQEVEACEARGEACSRLATDSQGQTQGHVLQSREVTMNDRARYEESIKCYDKAQALDAQWSWDKDGKETSFAAPEVIGKVVDQAIEKAIESAKSEREQSQIWACKAEEFLSLGNYKEAFDAYDNAIRLDPQDVGYFRIQAFLADHLGRHDQSLHNYVMILQMNPADPCAWFGGADALFRMERYDESLEAFEEALKREPGMIQAWIGKGDALARLGRQNEACLAYKKSLSMNDKSIHKNPNDCSARTWIARGDALKGLDRREEAIIAYDSAIERDPERFQAWCCKGDALMTFCRYDHAIDAYDKAIEKDPSIPRIWAKKGQALKALGRTSEAKEACARAEEMGYRR